MTRWLRNTHDGEIYEWDEILAENPRTEEVTEVGDDTPEELAEEATRGLERARNGKGHYVKDDPTTPQNEAWVKKNDIK